MSEKSRIFVTMIVAYAYSLAAEGYTYIYRRTLFAQILVGMRSNVISSAVNGSIGGEITAASVGRGAVFGAVAGSTGAVSKLAKVIQKVL